jgi:hypothetical protein
LRRYISVWVKVLRFIWRMSSPPKKRQAKSYHDEREQERCLEKTKDLARTTGAKNREEKRAEEYKFKAGEHEYAIISCIAALGLEDQDGGRMDAMGFHPSYQLLLPSLEDW